MLIEHSYFLLNLNESQEETSLAELSSFLIKKKKKISSRAIL